MNNKVRNVGMSRNNKTFGRIILLLTYSETIPLKVFTSCLRNAMFSFLTANNFIEHQIQKGFTPNLSGTLEHTAQMTNIINQARIKRVYLLVECRVSRVKSRGRG
jgi:hypothetical protein